MGMTPEDIGKLTLDELEAIAKRVAGAAETIREARALLGGTQSAPPAATPAKPAPAPPGIVWTPAEMAERERLKRQREAEALAALPENIRRAEQEAQ